jgi:hypothetical protein
MLRGLFTRRYFVSCLGGTAVARPLAANATEEVLAAWCAEARLGPRTIRAPGCVCLNFERGQTAH